MIPKSLAVFAVVGAAAAAVLGGVVAGMDSGPRFVEGASLSLVPEGDGFKRGQTVLVMLINSGTVPLEFSGALNGIRITQLDGLAVFTPGSGLPDILEPGAEALFEWDQLKDDGEPVLYGTYRILAMASAAGEQLRESVAINILR